MTVIYEIGTGQRLPLTRDRVLRAAVTLADAGGVESLSMRRIGKELGVEAMSLYNHVDNKDDILNGIIEHVMAEVSEAVGGAEVGETGDGWKAAMRHRILTARMVMLGHPWAPALIETRTKPGPSMLAFMDTFIGLLRQGGFSVAMAHNAMHALGSRMLGFTQELFDDDDTADERMTPVELAQMADLYPNIADLVTEVYHIDDSTSFGTCDTQFEFEFGLDLILDGLERLNTSA